MTLNTTPIRTFVLTLAIASTFAFGTFNLCAQEASAGTPATHSWTTDQILIATVHQAWLLADKNEANFFEIIKELAEISAKNRNMTLPDDPAAGQKAGAYIKKHARADHDQLLYAIVDKSVQMTGIKVAGQ